MIGGAVGLVTGLAAFVILKKFIYSAMSRARMTFLYGFIQPLLIIISLLCCALLIPGQLFLAGAGTAAVLLLGTIISTFRSIKADRYRNKLITGQDKGGDQ